jgi:hypothetical protein
MQIGMAQKHMDPMDSNPDGDLDPQHWILKYVYKNDAAKTQQWSTT